MCVAYPMKIKSIDGNKATISSQDTEQVVSIELLDEAQEGDYVIVHAGFAIEKLSVNEAEETIALLTQMAEPASGISGDSQTPGSGNDNKSSL